MKGVLDLLDYINPFSENFILKSIIENIANILSYINPFSDNFFGKKLVELIGDLLYNLFIPSEDSFSQIINVFEEKFAFIDSIKIAIDSIKNIIDNNISPQNYLTYEVDTPIYEGELSIDFSWFERFKPYTDLFLTGFIYLNFVWRIYRRLPNIIAGIGG